MVKLFFGNAGSCPQKFSSFVVQSRVVVKMILDGVVFLSHDNVSAVLAMGGDLALNFNRRTEVEFCTSVDTKPFSPPIANTMLYGT